MFSNEENYIISIENNIVAIYKPFNENITNQKSTRMRIYENFTSDNYIHDDIAAVCIGGFDGVHLGHQELLKYTKESSNLFQIVTFDTLPKNTSIMNICY